MPIYQVTCLSLILTLLCWMNNAAAYKYQNSRWRLIDLPVQCQLNIYVIPDSLSVREVEQAVIQSLNTWNNAAGFQIFQYAGRVSWKKIFADDGYNTISFVSRVDAPTLWILSAALRSLSNCVWQFEHCHVLSRRFNS